MRASAPGEPGHCLACLARNLKPADRGTGEGWQRTASVRAAQVQVQVQVRQVRLTTGLAQQKSKYPYLCLPLALLCMSMPMPMPMPMPLSLSGLALACETAAWGVCGWRSDPTKWMLVQLNLRLPSKAEGME